jgi:hypothetical protein
VDEAQDLTQPLWWELLRRLHSDPDGGEWHLAWDPDQAIYGGDPERDIFPLFPAGLASWPLFWNFRNTPGVMRLLQETGRWEMEGTLPEETREAEPLVRITGGSDERLEKVLEGLFAECEEKYGVDPAKVVVLGPHTLPNSRLGRGGRRRWGSWRLHDLRSGPVPAEKVVEARGRTQDQTQDASGAPTSSRIVPLAYETVYRFKGLEAEAVLLVDFDEEPPEGTADHERWRAERALLRDVALSRARVQVWELKR